uniref:Uncharacterized protein n=1 Tax=Anguilla anguilla TaxID=7936 RepID=A0A0E9V0P0_ANGAN
MLFFSSIYPMHFFSAHDWH